MSEGKYPSLFKGEEHKCTDCYLIGLPYCDQKVLKEYRDIFDECFNKAFDKVVQNPKAKLRDPTDEQFKKICDRAISEYHRRIEKKLGEEKVSPWGKANLKLKLKITNETYNHVKKIDDASEGAVGRDGSFNVETEPLIADNRLHSVIVTGCPLHDLCAEEEN